MSKYRADKVHARLGHVRFYYIHTDTCPRTYETWSFPSAAYDRGGVIARANKMFRTYAGITEEDIQLGKVNIYDCLNDENARLIEAARNAFDGAEKVYEGMGPAFHLEDNISAYEIKGFPNAIFFPMTFDHEGVKLAGIMLDNDKKEVAFDDE